MIKRQYFWLRRIAKNYTAGRPVDYDKEIADTLFTKGANQSRPRAWNELLRALRLRLRSPQAEVERVSGLSEATCAEPLVTTRREFRSLAGTGSPAIFANNSS
jgi:hypothetical protein